MPRPRRAAPGTRPDAVDPDLGPTRSAPSTQDKLEQAELATRALKLQHQRKQAEMTEQANQICRYAAERPAA